MATNSKRTPWNKGKSSPIKYIYYTDGNVNLRVPEGTECPEGFHRGRIKRQLTDEELAAAKEKQRQTNLAKYGTEYAFQAEEVKDKIKTTLLNKYGVECSFQAEPVKEKIRKTSLERYGTEAPSQSETIKQKRKQTCIEKYGVSNPAKLEQTIEKMRETCLKRYGVDNFRKTERMRQVMQENLDERLAKTNESKRLNKTFNSSSAEDDYYQILIETYGQENVVRQYSDERYPFACDFYIKSEDLFIELNLSWTHGFHKFDANNEQDLRKLSIWQEKAKTSDYYKNAIQTWTERDIKKFEFAEKNNLNYKTIYNL